MAPQGYDYSEVLIGQGPYYNPPMLRDADGDGETPERIEHVGYTSDIISDLTLKWLKEGRDPNKPFMLMTQHKAPHRNWQPGPKYLTKYDNRHMPEPPTLFEEPWHRPVSAASTKPFGRSLEAGSNDPLGVEPIAMTRRMEKWHGRRALVSPGHRGRPRPQSVPA